MPKCLLLRRIAATSVATRVAAEFRCTLGSTVGYAIRFKKVTSTETCIKYMTAGVLLREAISDPELRSYSIIMIDEAHERSLPTDFLLGLLKQVSSPL